MVGTLLIRNIESHRSPLTQMSEKRISCRKGRLIVR